MRWEGNPLLYLSLSLSPRLVELALYQLWLIPPAQELGEEGACK